ncbi:TPR domain [Cordyceps militaris]|uniref:TPR domain n=1 Tax=Cordyceps militaris TaxID=73501 RepID=A0A2H4SKY0_CORMI|nr:TPR domain [Cordyceps militaris]
MDTYDLSQEAQFAAMLQAGVRMHEIAQRRNGQLVHDHPPPASVVSQFLAARMGGVDLSSDPTKFVVSTTQLPPPYLPSECSVDELQPIRITHMRLGEHHRGTKVIVRILTPPRRINAVLAVAEDLAGTAVLLQLYHQPPATVFFPDEIIQKGSVLMIKEPFFKCSTDGSYSLRVDHLSDIVWLKPFDSRIPDVWRDEFPRMNSEAVRMRGNECVKNGRWAKALHFYSNAVLHAATPEDEQLASVNRALVNLKLNRPEQSLLDATKMKERIAPTEKAAFREFRALYELRLFDRCLERLQQFTANHPDNEEAKSEIKRVQARLDEQVYGAYSFSRMYKQAKASSALIDCATFSEPVEVREAPGRGRGLFTVKAVQAGDLLLCEKAFAYHQCDLSPGRFSILMDLRSKRCSAGGQVEILTQIIQNLYHNPEYSRSFLDLHRGDYKPVSRDHADGHPIVDSFLAAKIMSLNCFGAPRTSLETLSKLTKNEQRPERKRRGFGTAGVWVKASYVNHSCVGNCRRSFIGDMQIVRATRDLEAGTELLFAYRPAEELDSYEDVQSGLKHWGFTCDCALCQARRATPAQQLEKRKGLMKSLMSILTAPGATSLARGVRLIDEVKATYPASYPAEVPRLELPTPCFTAAMEHSERANLDKTVDMLLEGLEALGYEITAVWPLRARDAVGPPSSQFEVKKWGLAHDTVPWALFNLHLASKFIAPELSQRILQYAQTAYSMVVGEKETFGTIFPTT